MSMMRSWLIILTTLSFASAKRSESPTSDPPQLQLIVETTTFPDLYLNEPITLGCSGSPAFYDEISLQNHRFSGDHHHSSCLKTASSSWIANGSLTDALGLTSINNSYCATAAQSDPMVMKAKGKVNTEYIYIYAKCAGITTQIEPGNRYSKSFSAETLKVAPTNLTMYINGSSGMKVFENREFTFHCTSENAVPASTYGYEITTNGDMNRIKSQTYRPTERDRSGITLTCNDTAHPHWKLSQDVIKSVVNLKPYYISAEDAVNRTILLDPTFENTLKCDVVGYPISYVWYCPRCSYSAPSDDTAVIPNNASLAGSQETIRCSAFVESFPSVTIIWTIHWQGTKVTTTAPSTTNNPTPSTADNTAIIIGASVGSAVLLAVLVVFVALVCMYRRISEMAKRMNQSETTQHANENPAMERSERQQPGVYRALSEDSGYLRPHNYEEIDGIELNQQADIASNYTRDYDVPSSTYDPGYVGPSSTYVPGYVGPASTYDPGYVGPA